MIVELHFEDGFSGETVEVLVDGEVRTSLVARTRPQISLAGIEAVDVGPGQTLSVRVRESGNSAERSVGTADQYYVVSNTPDRISLEPSSEMPKHM